MGLGSSIFQPAHARTALRNARIPQSNQLYCLLPIGYPTDRQGLLNRKPVKAVVFNEKFAEPWPYATEQPDEGWGARWVK